MRSLPKQGRLAKNLKAKLMEETDTIGKAADPKAEAERRYDNARKAQWFKPVIDKLKRLSGTGQRCMYCSGSEASDVEHYRPKAVFPLLAMTWENYLWICTPCNRHKGDRFPPFTEPGGEFVNPLQEDVWRFFFIDEFGFLSPIYDRNLGALNPQGVSTRDFIDLNREAVQQSRQARLKDLKTQVRDVICERRYGKPMKWAT
ncbi:MAG: hypothetical protein NTW21_37440 [Verrucomicrobia bacterium]|nr:hypothetical protein [Verrucomicrobiota bacterium]